MKKYGKILIVILTLIVSISVVNTYAATGYTYDFWEQPIYSSQGMVITQAPYTFDKLGISQNDFKTPTDMFLYEEKYIKNGVEIKQEVIYVTDSTSNKLFVFDSEFNLMDTISSFKIYAEDFIDDTAGLKAINNLLNIKTAYSNNATLQSVPLITVDSAVSADKQYGYNLQEFKNKGVLEIKAYDMSGVYRAIHPKTGQDLLYISDKKNGQILLVEVTKDANFNNDYRVVQVMTKPDDIFFTGVYDELTGKELSKPLSFDPTKLVTDGAGRVYVICDGVPNGIVQLGTDGAFNRLTGVNYTTLSFWETFWRIFSTESQLKKNNAVVAPAFKAITIDNQGFIYATASAYQSAKGTNFNDSSMIKRINPSGKDVLRRNGYSVPKGDLQYTISTTTNNASTFTAIAVNDYGLYTVADVRMGRLFTYDKEGNLLYISGGSGVQLNTISQPVAMIYQGENIIVLDQSKQTINVFEPTDITKVINLASKYAYEGDSIAEAEQWEKVKKLNSNYELAYIGVGKLLVEQASVAETTNPKLSREIYKEAMENFKLGYDFVNYSKAYKSYRDSIIRDNFGWVMTGVIIVILGLLGYSVYKKIKTGGTEETGIGDE